MIVNVNARLTPNFSLMGFYNLTSANSDGGAGSSASNSYNLTQDYGRAAFASRNMLFLMANYQGPWAIRFNPFLVAQSGRPYNILTNQDANEDGFFNKRPSFATDASQCSSGSADFVQTSFGCLDINSADGSTPIPINMANGPAAVAVNLRVSRAFGVGPKSASTNNQPADLREEDLAVVVVAPEAPEEALDRAVWEAAAAAVVPAECSAQRAPGASTL